MLAVNDRRPHRDDYDDRLGHAANGGYSSSASHVGSAHDGSDNARTEFTLMVAGCRGGKTSFLRLLLDTCPVSQRASPDQLASVAKFVQGCSGHTSHMRAAFVDVEIDGDGHSQQLGLNLIDTPSIDFHDELAAERAVNEILRHIDARFAEGVEQDSKAHGGDRYIHLCIYFLDPDQIVPLSAPSPPVPVAPRTRNNSFSHTEHEPVILEPPVATNPLMLRPKLPEADVATIRRLSERVNVLPVIARADVLSNNRLSAIKLAVRRDLADSGIGFGIFDVDPADLPPPPSNGDLAYPALQPNGSGTSAQNSPSSSPAAPPLLRLPYALISPDIYSHSDGVPRKPPSRHELVLQYSPSYRNPPPSKLVRGKYLRSYRWGCLDVLDPAHCDFVTLRAAIFHHMETLQKYTREYLFDKFKLDYNVQQPPTSRHSLPHPSHGLPHMSSLSNPHPSRPVLAIDTASHGALGRQPPLANGSLELPIVGDLRPGSLSTRPPGADNLSSLHSRSAGPRSAKQRSKKITVACNFCRSRKLKCDGGRPACSQCVKRSNNCDYQSSKRRGTIRQRRGDESESDSEEPTLERDPSISPNVSTQPLPHRNSISEQQPQHGFDTYPPSLPAISTPDISPPRMRLSGGEARTLFPDNELPHIATLSLPDPSPSSTPVPLSAPSLPPILPASEHQQQAAQRKRAATVPGKSTRQGSTSGPKIVACNFCRARKTKCDGLQPSCSSCARRSLACNYVHDGASNGAGGGGGGAKKAARRASTSATKSLSLSLSLSGDGQPPPPPVPVSVPAPPLPRMGLPARGSALSAAGDGYDIKMDNSIELKRPTDYTDIGRPVKKMRLEGASALASASLAGIP